MSREQLLDLAGELDRLLAAGARSASGSDALRRRAKVVAELSAKVPALVPLKDALDRVLTAPAKDAPLALLDLLSRARQMRSGLAESTVPGDIGTVVSREGCQTRLPARRAHELYEIFTGSGGGKQSALAEAIKNNEINDLRLQRVLVDALDDKDTGFADAVSAEALPLLGKAILADLLATIDIPEGESGDARRLQAICKIDKQQGAELAHRALKEGSQKMIEQALESLPEVVSPAEAEKIGMEYARDKRADIRAAALKALRTSQSDECLALLFEKTDDKSSGVCNVAFAMLGQIAHTGTTDQIMDHVRQQLDSLTVVPAVPKEKKAAAKGAAKPTKAKGKSATPAPKQLTAAEIGKLQTRRYEELNRIQSLLCAMARRPDLQRQAVAEFAAPLIDHAEYQIQGPARSVLLAVGAAVPDVLPKVKKLIVTATGWQLSPIVEMMKGLSVRDRVELLPALRMATNKQDHVPYSVVQEMYLLLRLHADVDPAPLREFLEKGLSSQEPWQWTLAVSQLVEMDSAESQPFFKKVVDGYLAFVNRDYMPPPEGLVRLVHRHDPDLTSTLPDICKALTASKKVDGRVTLLRLLATLGPAAAGARPTVEPFLKDRNKEVKEQAQITLEAFAKAVI